MIYIIILFSLLLLIFIKAYTDAPLKLVIPAGILLVFLGVSFSMASEETKDLGELAVPFGPEINLKKSFGISEENESDDSLKYTEVSYELREPYENFFNYPTFDILTDESFDIKITLDKGFDKEYKIYLPKYLNQNVIEIVDFKSEKIGDIAYFNLGESSKIGSFPNEVMVNLGFEKILTEARSFSITFKVRSEVFEFDKINENGIGEIVDENFKIHFQNSKNDDEKIRLIVSEKDLVGDGKKFSLKVMSNFNETGFRIPATLKMLNNYTDSFDNYKNFIYDYDDTLEGGLKSEIVEDNFVLENSIGQKKSYILLSPKHSYLAELDEDYKKIVSKDNNPYFYFIVTRGGSIIVGENNNYKESEDYQNLIIEPQTLLAVKFEEKPNFEKLYLYKKDKENNLVSEEISYEVNEEGFLNEIKDGLEFQSEESFSEIDNILSFPTDSSNEFVIFTDENQTEILFTIKNGVISFDNKSELEGKISLEKIFINNVNEEITFLNLIEVLYK